MSIPITFIVPIFSHNKLAAYAKVDAADYPMIAHYHWKLMKNVSLMYARRYESTNGHNTTILMHRHILGLPPGRIPEVDHKNGDSLDNRRENLRHVTHAENCQNRHPHKNSSSSYRGVSWDVRGGSWRGRVRHNDIVTSKNFTDELQAAKFAQDTRIKLMPGTLEMPISLSGDHDDN